MSTSDKNTKRKHKLYELKEDLAHLQSRYEQLQLRISQVKKKINDLETDPRSRVIDPFDMKFED
jgi:uncharacterized protein YlxW (UPF0749 family)